MTTTPPEDQRICDWFESQSEEFINDLMEKHGYDLTPRKAWEAFFGSPAAQESQSESVPAPAEAVQQVATITCAACGSTNTEPCCHPAEFCQAICNDCNKPLNADGSVWVEKQEPTLEQFQRWLETEAHIVNSKYDEVLAGKGMSGRDWNKLTKRLAYLRSGFALVMQFKLEQGA